MGRFLSHDWAYRIGRCVGTVEALSGVKPLKGVFSSMMNAETIVWLSQYHLAVIEAGEFTDAVKEAFSEVLGEFPAEDVNLRMNMDGQAQFMLGYQQTAFKRSVDWREARKAAGLKQGEAAEALGLTQAALCRIESGKARPRASTAEKMHKLYNI